jgi:hypothetical protein
LHKERLPSVVTLLPPVAEPVKSSRLIDSSNCCGMPGKSHASIGVGVRASYLQSVREWVSRLVEVATIVWMDDGTLTRLLGAGKWCAHDGATYGTINDNACA